MLLLKHIRDSGNRGTQMEELLQVLPAQSRDQVRRLMDGLKERRLVRKEGERRWARWFAESNEGPK